MIDPMFDENLFRVAKESVDSLDRILRHPNYYDSETADKVGNIKITGSSKDSKSTKNINHPEFIKLNKMKDIPSQYIGKRCLFLIERNTGDIVFKYAYVNLIDGEVKVDLGLEFNKKTILVTDAGIFKYIIDALTK